MSCVVSGVLILTTYLFSLIELRRSRESLDTEICKLPTEGHVFITVFNVLSEAEAAGGAETAVGGVRLSGRLSERVRLRLIHF